MDEPYLPPSKPLSQPMERIPGYWETPAPAPAAPPQPTHTVRNVMLVVVAIIVALVAAGITLI